MLRCGPDADHSGCCKRINSGLLEHVPEEGGPNEDEKLEHRPYEGVVRGDKNKRYVLGHTRSHVAWRHLYPPVLL